MYLENAWYVGAWADEIGRTLFSRTICDQSILMYRREDGVAVALGNMCPHRFAPLSRGNLIGDGVQCIYHGLIYGDTGACIHNPHHGGATPAALNVAKYPVEERYGLIWLWMGDPEKADASAIPEFSFLDDPNYKTVKGVIEMKADYSLIADNLLDLTHVELVHDGTLSSPAVFASKLHTRQSNDTIWSDRWMPDAKAPPIWAKILSDYRKVSHDKNVDHWLYMRWDAPSLLLLDAGVTPTGRTREEGVWVYAPHLLTPSTKTHSFYFWAVSRNIDLEDKNLDDFWKSSVEFAFTQQDQPIIEAQQRMMGDRTLYDMKPVLLSADKAAAMAHRHLKQLIIEKKVPRPGGESLEVLRERSQASFSPVRPVV